MLFQQREQCVQTGSTATMKLTNCLVLAVVKGGEVFLNEAWDQFKNGLGIFQPQLSLK